MKIKEMYLLVDKNNELKRGVTTYGQAGCNLYGCVSVENLIDTLRRLLKRHEETEKKIDDLLNEWERAESAARKNVAIGAIIAGNQYEKSFYSEKYEEYWTLESNLYKSYHDIANAILTDEEVLAIQKQINYDFVSEKFVDGMVKLLENKEV